MVNFDGDFVKDGVRDGSVGASVDRFFSTFLAMILKKLTNDEKLAVNCGYVWRDI